MNRPGLYNGTSMDSLLHYLDQAGGIDAERGSFLAGVYYDNLLDAERDIFKRRWRDLTGQDLDHQLSTLS